MIKRLVVALFGALLMVTDAQAEGGSFYDIEATSIDGAPVKMSEYKGRVALIVNVASRCGFTSQYEGLQKLYDAYKEQGFLVLGFPSNDFGGQEPGTEAEIKSFCSSKFGANFPMFSKITVVGGAKHPLYQFLTESTGGKEVGWNFEKFLVDRTGKVVGRFPSSVVPAATDLTTAINTALQGQ
jgi:glutathione peroxidase